MTVSVLDPTTPDPALFEVWNLVPCFWRGIYAGGQPITGNLRITTDVDTVLVNDDDRPGNVFLRSVVVRLDPSGQTRFWLPASDDPDADPTGFTYTITEEFFGSTAGRTYTISVPIAAAEEGVEINRQAPVTPSPGVPNDVQVSYGDFLALRHRVHALEDDAAADDSYIAERLHSIEGQFDDVDDRIQGIDLSLNAHLADIAGDVLDNTYAIASLSAVVDQQGAHLSDLDQAVELLQSAIGDGGNSGVDDPATIEQINAIADQVHLGTRLSVHTDTDGSIEIGLARSAFGINAQGQVIYDPSGVAANDRVYPMVTPTGGIAMVRLDPEGGEDFVRSVNGQIGDVVIEPNIEVLPFGAQPPAPEDQVPGRLYLRRTTP